MIDDRDILLKTKLLVPERLWRIVTRPAAWILNLLPEQMKYSLGLARRKRRAPYNLIRENDVVFQIGAPRDLLLAGRSRAGYFLNLVSGSGKVVVLEPDEKNCEALSAFASRNGFSESLIVVNAGAWSSITELSFYRSDNHPASAALVDLSQASSEEMARRGYSKMSVPVTTVDSVINEHDLPVPRLTSITTNGAEIEILEGMQETIGNGLPYISLAITGDGYTEEMEKIGFVRYANDDRGFTFKKSDT